MLSPNQMENFLERIERQKYKNLAAVKLEIIEKVIKELTKPEESITIKKILSRTCNKKNSNENRI